MQPLSKSNWMPKKLKRSPKLPSRLTSSQLLTKDTPRSRLSSLPTRRPWPICRLTSKLKRRPFRLIPCHQRRELLRRSQLLRKQRQRRLLLSQKLRRLLHRHLKRQLPWLLQPRMPRAISQSKTRFSKLKNNSRQSRLPLTRKSKTRRSNQLPPPKNHQRLPQPQPLMTT